MTDLHSTLDAIDAATGCQQCEGPLGESPSGDFCGPVCQEAWLSARSEPLVGYQEPVDLAAHVNNLVELSSPETTPRWRGLAPLEFPVTVGTAFRSIAGTVVELTGILTAGPVLTVGSPWTLVDAGSGERGLTVEEPSLAAHVECALEARRNRNTGPSVRQRAPRRIDARGSR